MSTEESKTPERPRVRTVIVCQTKEDLEAKVALCLKNCRPNTYEIKSLEEKDGSFRCEIVRFSAS